MAINQIAYALYLRKVFLDIRHMKIPRNCHTQKIGSFQKSTSIVFRTVFKCKLANHLKVFKEILANILRLLPPVDDLFSGRLCVSDEAQRCMYC